MLVEQQTLWLTLVDFTTVSYQRLHISFVLFQVPCVMDGTVSRKVFVGGLPCSYPSSHIEDDLFNMFRVFGPLTVTWPGKKHFGGGKDIKGYVFLLFEVIRLSRNLNYLNRYSNRIFLYFLHAIESAELEK